MNKPNHRYMAFLLAAVLVLPPYVGQAQVSAGRLDAGRKVSKISHADGVRNHVKEGNVPDSGLQASLSENSRMTESVVV